MRRAAILVALLCIGLMLTACRSDLPQGAKEAIDSPYEGTSYTVLSAKKATEPEACTLTWEPEECWCVVLDPSPPAPGIAVGSGRWHALVPRRGLLWVAIPWDSAEYDFLLAGCDNW